MISIIKIKCISMSISVSIYMIRDYSPLSLHLTVRTRGSTSLHSTMIHNMCLTMQGNVIKFIWLVSAFWSCLGEIRFSFISLLTRRRGWNRNKLCSANFCTKFISFTSKLFSRILLMTDKVVISSSFNWVIRFIQRS